MNLADAMHLQWKAFAGFQKNLKWKAVNSFKKLNFTILKLPQKWKPNLKAIR
jgi:hypothetical protein